MGCSWKWTLYFVPAILASFAFMTGFLFSFWCESIQFPAEDDPNNYATLQFGPWYQLQAQRTTTNVGGQERIFVSDTCVSLPSGTEIDAKLKTVRAFSVITPIVGGLLTFGLWLAPCFSRWSDASWKKLAITFMVFITLFQGLTFLIFRSSFCTDNSILATQDIAQNYVSECQWDGGSTCNVVSVVLWFLTGVSMMLVGAPKRPERPPPETQTVTYQRTENPQGGGSTVAEVKVVKGTAVPVASNNNKSPPETTTTTPAAGE